MVIFSDHRLIFSFIPHSDSARIKKSKRQEQFPKYLFIETPLYAVFPESQRVVQDDSFSSTEKSLNNDLADPETALSDQQKQDEATSTFKPDQGPGFVAEPRVMLNPFFDQDLST